MTDPVLDAHREADLQYIISGPQPISIRDQILRGALIVRRLMEAGEITSDRPLAVVGAGAGGATAALVAADQGIPTLLVEKGSAGFQTQSLATSRWLNPTQYDWPVDHHLHGRFPWQPFHPHLPLMFGSAWANLLSQTWQVMLNGYSGLYPQRLDFRTGREVSDVRLLRHIGTGDQALELELDDGTTLPAGAAIKARGFGFENCRMFEAGTKNLVYEGQPFWGPDSFDRLRAADHQVLISGSGDGALQDYLRIVTQLPSAAAIVANCKIPSHVLHAVQSAEDRSLRGRSWADTKLHEAPYFMELEIAHRQQVAALLAQPQVLTGLAATVPSPPVPVRIVYREPYLTAYYGLNRFLALLISEFIVQRDGWQTLFPGTEISTIRADPHDHHNCIENGRAAGSYDPTGVVLTTHRCFERWHEVQSSGSGALSLGSRFNVIIVRHGLVEPPVLPMPRPRHLLPYHLL